MTPSFTRGQKVKVYNPGRPILAVVLDIEYANGTFIYLLKNEETSHIFRDKEKWIHRRHPYDM
ncbi:hypothetical protein ACP6PL_24790 [Dapis sp. BLCC M126]|uniref:hypothetical protein n=1 Tax=Dapis sp. BLCC M126 TaxID=3400189 RepID=UPI003CEA1947